MAGSCADTDWRGLWKLLFQKLKKKKVHLHDLKKLALLRYCTSDCAPDLKIKAD